MTQDHKGGSQLAVNSGNRLFPPHLLHARWHEFQAEGYAKPVTGVIYRGDPRPTCGMPLGGLDTGCIDIEPNGMLGYSTIFNHLVNPRLLLNLPFLGLHCEDKSWVLISDTLGKDYTPKESESIATFPPIDYTPRFTDIELEGVEIADSIDYWGHYPIVDMEFNTSASVEVGLRAWSPFIPGDTAISMGPGAVFELTVRNPESAGKKGTLVFSFPGFELSAEGNSEGLVRHEVLQGELNGLHVESGVKDDAWEMAYVLAAIEEDVIRCGGPLNADGGAWARIAEELPHTGVGETGASLAFDFNLSAGETKTYRLVLAWHAPHWRAGGAPSHSNTNLLTHMYAKHHPDALTTARLLGSDGESLLQRIISWQEVIYQDSAIPGWLADSLINNLYLIPECSIWGQAKAPIGDWCKPDDGVFGLNECPRGCPQIECLPCSFYGNIPLVYFFPETALSTLRGQKAYQYEDGRPPWIFGGVTAIDEGNRPPYELSKPDVGYQTVLNGACYIIMADRIWRASEDDGMLEEFWESLKRCNDFSMNLRPAYGLSQVIAMPTPGTDSHGLGDTEWFEAPDPGWKGYVTHAGAVRLAQVRIMHRMAEAMNDHEYLKMCDDWIEAGEAALEEHLWTGEYYLNFNEPETGQKSDLIFGYQLDGQWITDWHGVPGVFPRDRVDITLETLRKFNCALSQSGALNYTNSDGALAKVGGYGTYSYFPPELYMLAMTYMYGGQQDFGLELLHKCMYNIVCRWGYTWDMPNTVRGDADTGQQAFGADYYQNMMLWGAPAAVAGSDLTGPCQSGGLVDRVIQAGK